MRVLALHPTHGREQMKHCIETSAPWLSEGQRQVYYDDYPNADHLPSREHLRERVWISIAEREIHRAKNIPPFDLKDDELAEYNRDKKRLRDQWRRRQTGAKPREVYLSESKSRTQPWESLGLTRATYYRRGLHRETSPRQLLTRLRNQQPINLNNHLTDEPCRCETTPRLLKTISWSADLSHLVNGVSS